MRPPPCNQISTQRQVRNVPIAGWQLTCGARGGNGRMPGGKTVDAPPSLVAAAVATETSWRRTCVPPQLLVIHYNRRYQITNIALTNFNFCLYYLCLFLLIKKIKTHYDKIIFISYSAVECSNSITYNKYRAFNFDDFSICIRTRK